MALKYKPSYPSGPVPPGASLGVEVVDDVRGIDGAPDGEYDWDVYHDGRILNAPQLSALCEAEVPHTWNRKFLTFKLKPEVRGVFEMTCQPSSEAESLGPGRWRWEVKAGSSALPVTLDAVRKIFKEELEQAAKDGLFR